MWRFLFSRPFNGPSPPKFAWIELYSFGSKPLPSVAHIFYYKNRLARRVGATMVFLIEVIVSFLLKKENGNNEAFNNNGFGAFVHGAGVGQ